jgi:hypothetical protein
LFCSVGLAVFVNVVCRKRDVIIVIVLVLVSELRVKSLTKKGQNILSVYLPKYVLSFPDKPTWCRLNRYFLAFVAELIEVALHRMHGLLLEVSHHTLICTPYLPSELSGRLHLLNRIQKLAVLIVR